MTDRQRTRAALGGPDDIHSTSATQEGDRAEEPTRRLERAPDDVGRLVHVITEEATYLVGASHGAFVPNPRGEGGRASVGPVWSGSSRDGGFPQNSTSLALLARTLERGELVRCDDLERDTAPPSPAPGALRSYLAAPLTDSQGQVLGALVLGHADPQRFSVDHERLVRGLAVNAATALESARSYEQARAADRRKDEFLAMLAHELRGPLAPIRNAVHLLGLRKTGLPGEVRDTLGIIDRQVRQLSRLVDDLLDVARIARDRIELRVRRVSVAEVVAQGVETARPAIDARGHRLRVTLGPDPVELEADPDRLSQVVGNLLHNAAKYMDPGGRIDLSVEREGDEAVLQVRDDGLGIPAEDLPRVFDLFAQSARSLDRSEGGLGLGLSLVRRLVEMHGGSVAAYSDGPGRGSTFTIRIPALASPLGVQCPSPTYQEALSSPSLRVLVVDDNRDSGQSLELLLGSLGHEVHTASDGLEALDAVASLAPDVVLLDLGLPKLDGFQVAAHLGRDPRREAMTLIAITGYGDSLSRRRSAEVGFDHHLLKPVDLLELRRLIAAGRRSLRPLRCSTAGGARTG